MSKVTFKGFSTSNKKTARREWVLTDSDLIIKDFMNHVHTKKGERVMRPEFGSSFHQYIMEPNVTDNIDEMEYELRRIVDLDSRLELVSLDVRKSKNSVFLSGQVYLVPFDLIENFIIEFDTRQGDY